MLLISRICNKHLLKHLLRPLIEKTQQFTMFKHVSPIFLQHSQQHNLQIVRYKTKKKSTIETSTTDSDENEQFEDKVTDKSTRVMVVSVPSLRVDTIIKAGLGLARNKIETLFYQSKIRVNGEKIMKKSLSVSEGDEIDVIKSAHPSNDKLLIVARVEVLNIHGEDDHMKLKLRRCKTLIVENYDTNTKSNDD